MRKLFMFCSIVFIMVLLLVAGCSKEESARKLTSRPVVAEDISPAAPAEESEVEMVVDQPAPEPVVTRTATASSGSVSCEQLSGSDIGGVLGGTWTKTSDCPTRPMMPKGVEVCQCAFDGPKSMYFNLETQLYDDEAEAIRVFKMYCDDETNEVGDMACRQVRSSTTTPNFIYFLKGNYFVKVSCLGGSCPLDGIAELAKLVDAEI